MDPDRYPGSRAGVWMKQPPEDRESLAPSKRSLDPQGSSLRGGGACLWESGALTDVIVGLADVIVPDRDVQGLLRQVTMFDVIEKLLDAAEKDR